ncbi:hypothetical protein JOC75_000439 [Metabacillus crassostreae]|uniref:DUF3885 domain-containing protein n=1 Tax=Metabacillus crassostreae TaxID=929098 RepID=UPI00195B2A69|nr:DUF3885 domain-containing protein [Metabacillus crassostreae]MBM7602469.1 hypothetical protein [Metabacillus crassostreae]
MENIVSKFMEDHFDNLSLRPPLFYLWKYGIRFEISMPGVEHEDENNLQQINERTTTLFKSVFNQVDEMLLITDINCEKNDSFLQKRSTKVYQKYIKNKETVRKLQHIVLPNVFSEDEEDGEDYTEMVTHRFVLPCKMSEIRYHSLLKAISYEDFYHPNQILKGFPRHGIDIYFINLTRKMIYHLYDDRGCDVIASDKEELYFLYESFNEWILDYDRDEIDKVFKRNK